MRFIHTIVYEFYNLVCSRVDGNCTPLDSVDNHACFIEFEALIAEYEEEQTISGVTIQTFYRDREGAEYQLSLTQENINVVATTTIGWCFPDGDSRA